MSLRSQLICGVFCIFAAAYFLSYLYFSRLWGMSDGLGDGKGNTIWAFQGLSMQADRFTYGSETFDFDMHKKEQRWYRFYYPLVQLDEYLENYHILDTDTPAIAGG